MFCFHPDTLIKIFFLSLKTYVVALENRLQKYALKFSKDYFFDKKKIWVKNILQKISLLRLMQYGLPEILLAKLL